MLERTFLSLFFLLSFYSHLVHFYQTRFSFTDCCLIFADSADESVFLYLSFHIFVSSISIFFFLKKSSACHVCGLLSPREYLMYLLRIFWGFLGGSAVKHLPAMQETWIRSLDREDPLQKEMATHSSILAWTVSWTEKLGGEWSIRS